MNGDVIEVDVRSNSKQLQDDLTKAKDRAKELRKELADIEKTSGKGSDEWKKYKAELKETQEQAAKLTKELRNMDVTKMTFSQLKTYVNDLNKELKNMVPGSAQATAQLKKIGEAEAQFKKVSDQAKKIKDEAADLGQPGLWGKITSGVKSIGTAFQAIIALQIIQWMVDIGKAVFTTTATFEKYEKVLTTALGGQKEAKAAMEAIKKMAKETSFGVDELTEGYVKMVNRGLRPSQSEMTKMADLAASQGKTFDMLIEGILDAQTGEFERLKEFGVKARKEGDNVSLTFNKQTQTVKNNEEAIYQAIIAMGAMTGVAGQNAIMMETLGGKASNFGDVMDSLKTAIGDRLSPIFKFFLDLLADGIEWLVKVINASDPLIQVFEDIFSGVGQLASSFINIFSNVFPKFNASGLTLATVMQGIAVVFRAVLTPIQIFIGGLTMVYDAISGVVQGGKALVQFLAGDFSGAAKTFENSKTNFSNISKHATESYEKIKSGWTDAFVTQPKKDSVEAAFAAGTSETKKQDSISEAQKKAAAKQAEQKQKAEGKINEMIAQLDAEHNQLTADNAIKTEEFKIEEKRRKRLKEITDSIADEKTKEAARIAVNRNADAEIIALREKDNKKALELLSQMESEHSVKTAKTALEAEEAKIAEIQRKRLADIEVSKADETVKTQLIEAINRNAEASLDKVRGEYRQKRIKEQEEADRKLLEQGNFLRDQEQKAEMTLFDWQITQARGNADRIAQIKKDRVDAELRFTQQKLEAEMMAEGQKAISLIQNDEQLAVALNQIEDRHHVASVAASKKASDDKLAIDKDLHEKKAANLKAYSDMFGSLLADDVSGFLQSAQTMVKGHQEAWQQKLSADMASYQQGGEMAMQAVAFLNNLAQKKAEKAIAEANRERDEKVAILTNELSVTESMVKTSSDYVTALKSAETERLAELQRILTSETTTEEQKRDALKKYYSDQLQQMKAAEEAKIQDLQRLANLAKTEDERQAIEAKIQMAKKESEEKIRVAEQELEAKKTNLSELQNFTTEVTNEALAEANKASEKQITIASDEAEQKADFKADLEETIAAENRKARAVEQAEKTKAFKAQKKADIATALITGALAVLKALANFFPLNIILAATAAVVTGVQIAKIKNQPDPVFALGGISPNPSFADGGTLGHVPQGGKHGISYGTGGIQLLDRATGRDVGEMEGGEAIISTKQTEANWPLIQQMFKNARTPGKTNTPVIPHPATPMAFRDGGKFESPYFERGMYLFGSKKRKAEQAAKDAEAEAARAQAEADAAMADMPSFDSGAYGGIDSSDPSASGDTAGAAAQHEEARKMGKDQLQAILDILQETKANGDALGRVVSIVGDLKGSVNGVEGAVNSVRDAVYNTNTQGKFDQLIGAISSMSA